MRRVLLGFRVLVYLGFKDYDALGACRVQGLSPLCRNVPKWIPIPF